MAVAVEERLVGDLKEVARESRGTIKVRQTRSEYPDFVVRGPL